MRTIKLKRKIRKNTKRNKTSRKNKMIRGGSLSTKTPAKSVRHSIKPSIKNEQTPSRKPSRKPSTRGLPIEILPVVILGKGDPTSYSYNNQILDELYIKNIVDEKIKPGYQLVTFPMPPSESHSIIVNVIVNVSDSIVKIVDWNGQNGRTTTEPKWINYKKFIDYLEEKYGTLTYYRIDDDIKDAAICRYNKNNGQGGCSEYVHTWIEKFIGENGKKAVLPTPFDQI
jgi:hypothetical protein